MKRIALTASLALALAAPAFAQDTSQTMPPEESETSTSDAQTNNTQATTGHSTTVYHGPHHYPMKTRGRAGDPPIIDHSKDALIVEPTHSTITIVPVPE